MPGDVTGVERSAEAATQPDDSVDHPGVARVRLKSSCRRRDIVGTTRARHAHDMQRPVARTGGTTVRRFRTVLEQRIWERRQTLEEFVEYAERFAREHDEPGTLGVRHLQRLVSGRGPKGQPLGPVRPATARLLEHIFGLSIDELLAAPPTSIEPTDDSAAELRQMLHASSRIDGSVLALFQEQMTSIRKLDRQLGAVVARDEVRAKTAQLEQLVTHSLTAGTRERLAALLSELQTLAGWQALDMGRVTESWRHYEQAKSAALESGMTQFEIYTTAEQAFVLLEVGQIRAAIDALVKAREIAERKCSPLLRSWLAAAHGEMLAANNQRDESLRAFNIAEATLPSTSTDLDGPYVALDPTHLARWRGHALARFADPEALNVLTDALDKLDPTYTRAETALRVDLATALAGISEQEALKRELEHAARLASIIGSRRQQRRIHALENR